MRHFLALMAGTETVDIVDFVKWAILSSVELATTARSQVSMGHVVKKQLELVNFPNTIQGAQSKYLKYVELDIPEMLHSIS